MKHLNNSSLCKAHYNDDDLHIIEELLDESNHISAKKLWYDSKKRHEKYLEQKNKRSGFYDPAKRKESYLEKKKEKAEHEAKKQQLEEKESRSRLKDHMLQMYENDARDKNRGEKKRSDKELQTVFDLIECNSNPSEKMIHTLDDVKENFDKLYKTFESEIDILSEKSKTCDTRDIDAVYLNLYIFRPFNINFSDYSNRLFHTWQDERTKNLKPLKEFIESLGIAYDWDEYDLFKSSCDRCNICKPTNTTNKTEY